MNIFFIILGYSMMALVVFEITKHYLKKYINERINENLALLNKLDNINNELDDKISDVKMKLYNIYLDRCRENLKKKRKMDKEARQTVRKIKDKISKK